MLSKRSCAKTPETAAVEFFRLEPRLSISGDDGDASVLNPLRRPVAGFEATTARRRT